MTYTVITGGNCPWCSLTCELLEFDHKPYVTVETSKVRTGLSASMRTLVKMAGFTTVPQVFAPDGTHIGGYEDLVKYLGSN